MARSILVFEDAPDGLINFKVTHVDGFSTDSNAHKLSIQTVKWLDEQAQWKSNVKVDTEPTDALQNGHDNGASNIDAIRRMASAGEPLIDITKDRSNG